MFAQKVSRKLHSFHKTLWPSVQSSDDVAFVFSLTFSIVGRSRVVSERSSSPAAAAQLLERKRDYECTHNMLQLLQCVVGVVPLLLQLLKQAPYNSCSIDRPSTDRPTTS